MMRQERMEEEARQNDLDAAFEVIGAHELLRQSPQFSFSWALAAPNGKTLQHLIVVTPDAFLQAKQAALQQAEEEKTAKRRAKRLKKKVPSMRAALTCCWNRCE
jgi:hypothetical protein